MLVIFAAPHVNAQTRQPSRADGVRLPPHLLARRAERFPKSRIDAGRTAPQPVIPARGASEQRIGVHEIAVERRGVLRPAAGVDKHPVGRHQVRARVAVGDAVAVAVAVGRALVKASTSFWLSFVSDVDAFFASSSSLRFFTLVAFDDKK